MLILHTNARKKTTAALICFKNLHSNFLVIVLKGTYDRFPYFFVRYTLLLWWTVTLNTAKASNNEVSVQIFPLSQKLRLRMALNAPFQTVFFSVLGSVSWQNWGFCHNAWSSQALSLVYDRRSPSLLLFNAVCKGEPIRRQVASLLRS